MDAAELLGVSMGSKSCFDSFKTFTGIDEFVSAKLDLFEVRNTRKDQSFTFRFHYMVKIRISIFYFLFLFFFFLSNVWHSFFFVQAFLDFAKAKCLGSSTKVSLDEAVRKNTILDENSKKLQEHITMMKERDAHMAL